MSVASCQQTEQTVPIDGAAGAPPTLVDLKPAWLRRRRYGRLPLRQRVSVRHAAMSQLGATLDISWGGVFVEAAPFVPVATPVQVTFRVSPHGATVSIPGVVVRISRSGALPGYAVAFSQSLDTIDDAVLHNLLDGCDGDDRITAVSPPAG